MENDDASDCVPEVPTVTGVAVSGLVDIGNSKKGTKSKDLTVAIEDNGKVSHYYLTHDSTFTPTSISDTEGRRSWSGSKPNSYTLSPVTIDGTIDDGTYTLYLWVADVTETVVGSVASSDSFVLDTTAPPAPTLHATTKPDAKDSADSVVFGQPGSTDASGGEVTFSYCLETPGGGIDCSANDAPFTAVNDVNAMNDWNSDLTLPTTTKGDYEITFKATDKLDHVSTSSQPYAWKRVVCVYNSDSKSNPTDEDDTFSLGDKTRACTASDKWGDWTITCTDPRCIICGGGQYLQAGSDSCTGVTDNSGKYSPANNVDLLDCDAKPDDHSVWNYVAANQLSADCNWDCQSGYVKDGSTCRTPKQDSDGNNQYADADNNNVERGCPAKPTESDWVTLTGGMTKDEACAFDCHASHPNKDKANNACYAAVADCEPNELPMGAAAGTKDYTSAGKYGSCKVKICRAGYKKGLEGTVCFMPLSLLNTVPLDNGKKGAPSDRRIQVRMRTGFLLSHIRAQGDYYLTHQTPSQFTPRGDISSSEAREGGREWFKGSGLSDFVEYTLPSNLANGEYRLYLWVADASQEAVSSQPLGESDPFTVDSVGPVITKVAGPSGDVPFGDGTVSFTLQGEDSGVGLKSLSYCKNPKIACYSANFQGITSGVPFSLSYNRSGTQTITVKAVDKLDNERFQTFTWNMRRDLKCIANEVKTLAISNGREIKTCNENGQAWKSSNTVCDTGYTLSDHANGCHAKQIDCQYDKDGTLTDGGVKVLNTDDGSYGSCGVPPTVSIDRGNIPNISVSVFLSDDGLTLGGACSIDSGDVEVTLSINDFENFKAIATGSASCTGGGWEKGIDITVPYMSGEPEKTWKIEVTHSDADGRTATALSTVNRLCPDHYVLVPALWDYATQPFCVARYEMKQDGSNILPKYDTLPKAGVTRDEAIGFCQDPDGDGNLNNGYDLITNDEWQALARDIELVASNWSEGAVGSGDLSKGFSGGHLGAGTSLLKAEKDDNNACSGITGIGSANPCSGTTWNTQRRTFTLSNGEVIWDLVGNAWEWVKDSNTAFALSTQAQMTSAFSNEVRAYTLKSGAGASGYVSRNTKGHFGSHGSYTKDLVLKTYFSPLQTGTLAGLLRGGAYHQTAGLFSVMFGLPTDQLPSVSVQSQTTEYHNTLGFRCVYRPPSSPVSSP